jgi:kynurenine formamidase
MIIHFSFQNKEYQVNLSQGFDISIPLKAGFDNPNCFYAPAPEFEPVRAGNFVGDTTQGGAVNFKNVRFNPHGNGTHTECVGHIAKERFVINDCLKTFHFMAKLVTIYPEKAENGDRVIRVHQIKEILEQHETQALILRTMPNDDLKKLTNYSNANPPYLEEEAMQYIVECGIIHFLTDLPSVDREEDGGKLLAHRAFWQYPNNIRTESTITEMIYVQDSIKDGYYLLNLQIASFELDASPSKPVLYKSI